MKELKYIVVILFLLSFSKIFSQETSPVELIGDRPDQTESAFIVPKGYFQFEDGFLFENESNRIQNFSYSSILLRYGLFENFELRFGTEYNKIISSGLDEILGFSPISIGSKIHVHKEKGWIPQIAFLVHLNIAKTGAKDFLQNYHNTQMAMTFNHTLSDFWSVGYSIGVEFLAEDDYSVGTYTLVSGVSVTDKTGVFIEAYGDFSKHIYADNKINAGVTYLLLPNLQFDFAGGIGLSEKSAENYFGIGFIYLFKI